MQCAFRSAMVPPTRLPGEFGWRLTWIDRGLLPIFGAFLHHGGGRRPAAGPAGRCEYGIFAAGVTRGARLRWGAWSGCIGICRGDVDVFVAADSGRVSDCGCAGRGGRAPDGSVRLEPENLIGIAKKLGRSSGYILHHWKHERLEHAWRRRLRWGVVVAATGFRRRPGWWIEEGKVAARLGMVQRYWMYRQTRFESRRPRNYSERGWLKRDAGTDCNHHHLHA